MALLPQFSYNSLDSEEEKKKKKNVKLLLKATSNEGSKEKIEDAKNNYNYSAKINKYLESNYRTKAAQNNIVLPSKKSSSSSLKSLQPNNFTILENDKKSNLKPSNTIVDIDTLKNKQNFNNKSNPLSLDITPKLQAGVENVKRYNDYIKRTDVRSDLIDLKDSRNELALDRYNLDLEKVNNKDINLYDKTLGRFVRGAKSMLLNTDTKYTRDDGVEVSLPTYNDLLEQKTAENYNTGVGKFLGEATSNIGRIVTSSVINRVLPGVGTITYFGDMFMDQYNNNLLEGYDESSSLMNASIGTISEVVTEKLLGGISKQIFGGNSSELSAQVAKGISKLTKNKKIVSVFSNASSEAIEEFLQTYTEKLNDQITLEKDFDIKELFSKDTLSEAIYSAGIGAVSGGVLSSFSGVDPNISDIVDKRYNTNLNNETNTLIDSNEYNNVKKYTAVPSENDKITNFRNSVQNSDAIDNEKTTYVMNTIEKVINDKNYNIIFDSSIINKNGRSVDGLITTNSNNEVEIRLNPLSNRSVEFLLTHEITHSIETTELKNLVLNFASKNSKFNENLKKLQETYGTTDVSSEVLADISGQLLGNEEFINNLKMDNTPKSKNIIKIIYESIKKLLNNLTEKGRYRNFVKDLESKWADAYKTITTEQSIENLKNDKKFSIQTDINGNKYVNVDTNQNIFEGKTLVEQTKIAKEYILDNFKGKELSINDNSVMVTRKTANEYTHPKTTLQKNNASSKMKASTELDNLLSISEYKYSKADDGRHKFAKDGWDYYKTTFKVGNAMYNGLINIAKNGNKKMLYDITNLKRNTQISSPVNTATESIGISLSNNNISQSNNNVNSDTSSTKYSMQEVNNNSSDISNSLKKEIILKSKENLKNDKSIKFKDINEILELQDSEGGYREYNNDELISSIKKEGFKEPINLMIDSKGNISIEDGNHRLEVAKRLGLDVVPVKFVESYAFDNSDVIWYNQNENFDYIKKFQEDYLNGINRTTKNVNRFYEELRNINGSNSISNELDGNGRRTKRVVHMADGESGLGKRSQFETTNSKNDLGKKKSQKRSREELDNSSFSIEENSKRYADLLKSNTIKYYRKNNGDVSVLLVDNKNNLINELNLWSNTQTIKELGAKLGTKIYETATEKNQTIELNNDITTDLDYFMSHRPTESGITADNLINQNVETPMPQNIYEHPEWYFQMNKKYSQESMKVLSKIRNNPNADITIYRATTGDKINPGDWVTLSKEYAKLHNESSLQGKGKIIEMVVKAKDIQFAGDDINEFGYFPSDTKYSMQEDTNNSWQKYLEENYPTRGTTTKFSEFILPKYKEEVSKSKIKQSGVLPKGSDVLKDVNLSFNSDGYLTDDASKNIKNNSTELKQKNIQKIENNKQTITKLETSRNKTLKSIDLEIKEKRKLYDSKKKKNTKIANVIQQQIITLEARKKSITEAYKQRIDRLEDRNKKLSSKDNYTNIQRKSKNIEYKELAESIIIDNINTWKDKSMGIEYKLEKMERIFYDVIPDKKVAKQMVDTYIVPLKIAESNQKHFINEYVNRIKKFNLTNEEAVAVQLLGEATFNTSSLNNNIKRAKKTLLSTKADQEVKKNAQFYLNTLDYIEKNNLNIDRIQYHVNEFKKIYNELFLKINKVLKEQGYKEMDYRKDYFPHFVEEHANTKIGKLMEKLGWKSYNNKIPTDIAGKTDTFKPGRTYFGHLKHRTGNFTEYNALKGFDNYIVGASNLIFLTEPIQKLRALENEIRYLHSEKGVQQKYNEIITSDLDTDTKDVQIAQLFADARNPLNNFVTELRSYTDGIANKKSELDRRLEQAFNRGIYGTMTNINNRVSANMVGMNISSALTNFIPITQAYSQVSAKNMLKAIKSTLANSITSDGFVENSEFLSNRLIKSEKLYMTNLEKISEKANVMFDAVDSFTSNVVTRAKYYENIEKGMKSIEALKDADTFANNVIAGRDKASLPTIFNSKNFVVKLFSSFQLEVNNQYRYMFKDLPSDLKDEALSKLIGAYVKMFFGAWLYNFFAEKITGRKSAFSPADIVLDSIKTIENDNGSAFGKSVSILKDVAGEVPFVGNILGGGRLPISSALPNLSNSADALSTIFDKDAKDSTKKTAKNNLKKEILKPLYYVVPPFGGGQLKKTIEGASIHLKDVPGSYTSSGKLRFTAENGLLPTVKDMLFGQYSSKNAREYFENDYEPLTLKQQEEFLELDVDLTTYRKYYADFKEIDKIQSDKDENDNSISGTATAKKIYEILNNDKEYSEKELNYLFSKLSTESYNITLDDISLLDNDIDVYKYYFGLSTSSKDSFLNIIEKTQINQKEYVDTMKFISETKEKYKNIENPYHGEEYTAYKTYLSKLKKNEIYEKINSLGISKYEKILLYKSAGYSINNYKEYLFNYINNLNISKAEKNDLWEYFFGIGG